jgi:hypothetical protein
VEIGLSIARSPVAPSVPAAALWSARRQVTRWPAPSWVALAERQSALRLHRSVDRRFTLRERRLVGDDGIEPPTCPV